MAAVNSTLNARYTITVTSARILRQVPIICAGHATDVVQAVRTGWGSDTTLHHVRSFELNDTFAVRMGTSSISKASSVIRVVNRQMYATGHVAAAMMVNGAIVTNVLSKEEFADIPSSRMLSIWFRMVSDYALFPSKTSFAGGTNERYPDWSDIYTVLHATLTCVTGVCVFSSALSSSRTSSTADLVV